MIDAAKSTRANLATIEESFIVPPFRAAAGVGTRDSGVEKH
jgi:hypothetical protein